MYNKRELANFLSKYIPYLSLNDLINMIEIPPREISYTYAFPTFQLAKHEKKAPQKIAKELKEKLELPEFIKKVELEGAYLNFLFEPKLILENIYKFQEDFGKKETINKLRYVIEFPAPNTNKPLHLGHIRNMLLGQSLSNLLEYVDHKVFKVNLNNDRGIHICKSMLAYKKWGENEEPDKKSDHFVGDFYVKYNQEEEKNPNLKEEAHDLLKLWEKGDPETRELWKKMNNWALQGFKQTYNKFNIEFDKEYFESDIYKEGKEKIQEGVKEGVFEELEDGAIKAPLEEKYNLPDKILLRRDGTSVYITQDIYLAYQKKEDFDFDKSIYVVGSEQNLYFRQLFAVLDLLEFEEETHHLSYGMIYLPSGKMKSREGTVVDADELIEEMYEIAYQEVDKRYPGLSKEEKDFRANVISMSAIRFYILKYNQNKDFTFFPDESISFEGETGPYVQYVYARIQSIIEKSQEKVNPEIKSGLFKTDIEKKVINQLNYFPEIIENAASSYDIHLITEYLLNLAQKFNSFYTSCQVIGDDKPLERARLLLIRCVQIVIKIGLEQVLGITTLKNM
ncbi:MAG: Arginine--tRNA ligase [Promethearchaeota archaeon]|nr:MAG: Arginine--tRNA ligase [Candidatus Lokiarchaeota archaeon]